MKQRQMVEDIQVDRQTDGLTDRQAERQTYWQTVSSMLLLDAAS